MVMTNFEQTREHVMQLVPSLKHCQLLGIEALEADVGKLSLKLPYHEKLIGNPDSKVVNGGPITTLMDTACGFAAVLGQDEPGICPTLDLRIDYMRPAEPGKAIIGAAEAYRVSRSVIFTRGIAFHEGDKDNPIAHCTASFMRLSPEAIEKGGEKQ